MNYTGTNYKRSMICICGKRKNKGMPFCPGCWGLVTQEERSTLRSLKRDPYNEFYAVVVKRLRDEEAVPAHDADPVYQDDNGILPRLHPMALPEPEELLSLQLTERQMDALFMGMAKADKAAALNYFLELTR